MKCFFGQGFAFPLLYLVIFPLSARKHGTYHFFSITLLLLHWQCFISGLFYKKKKKSIVSSEDSCHPPTPSGHRRWFLFLFFCKILSVLIVSTLQTSGLAHSVRNIQTRVSIFYARISRMSSFLKQLIWETDNILTFREFFF